MFAIAAISGDGMPRARLRDPGMARRASRAAGRGGPADATPAVLTPAPVRTRRRRGRLRRRSERRRDRRSIVASARRLVVKVGSSLVTNDGRGLDHAAVARWADEIAALKRDGREVVLVSSGAIAEGMQAARLDGAAHGDPRAAGRGRGRARWGSCRRTKSAFAEFGLHTAQILLTHDDLADRRRYLNARSTLTHAARAGGDPDHQRERHGHDRRDPRRRQRHARRARHQPDRGRRAGPAHRPARALHGGPAARSRARRSCAPRSAGDPALEAMAGGAGTRSAAAAC